MLVHVHLLAYAPPTWKASNHSSYAVPFAERLAGFEVAAAGITALFAPTPGLAKLIDLEMQASVAARAGVGSLELLRLWQQVSARKVGVLQIAAAFSARIWAHLVAWRQHRSSGNEKGRTSGRFKGKAEQREGRTHAIFIALVDHAVVQGLVVVGCEIAQEDVQRFGGRVSRRHDRERAGHVQPHHWQHLLACVRQELEAA
eukprot:SAG11_NODE_6193_length_1368_cov_1.008668_2_plen_200_part_01